MVMFIKFEKKWHYSWAPLIRARICFQICLKLYRNNGVNKIRKFRILEFKGTRDFKVLKNKYNRSILQGSKQVQILYSRS